MKEKIPGQAETSMTQPSCLPMKQLKPSLPIFNRNSILQIQLIDSYNAHLEASPYSKQACIDICLCLHFGCMDVCVGLYKETIYTHTL